MKTLKDLLLLGDPRLYEKCEPVLQSELLQVKDWVADLDNVMKEITWTGSCVPRGPSMSSRSGGGLNKTAVFDAI